MILGVTLNHQSQSSKCGDSQPWLLGALPLLSELDPPQWIDGDVGNQQWG